MTEPQLMCGYSFDTMMCVAPRDHDGPHITSNERFPHGLPRADRVGGSAEPVAPPPDNGRWSDERLRGARHQDVLELFKQLVWRVARGGQQRDEVERFHHELLRRMALACAPQGDPPEPSVSLLDDQLFLALRDVAQIEFEKYQAAGVSVHGAITAATRVVLNVIIERLGRVPAPQGDAAPPSDYELLLLEMNLARATDELNHIPELRREDELFLVKASLETVREWRVRGGAPSSGSAPPNPGDQK